MLISSLLTPFKIFGMKGLSVVCALLVAAILLFAPCTAYAQSTEYQPTTQTVYARALSRGAYFCTLPDLATSTFAVPYTYCVEVLSDDGEWFRVKYAEDYGIYRAVYGYVQKRDFELVSERPQTVYLYKPISVTFSQDAPSGNLPVIGDITVTAAFYGSYYSGAAGYSYVLCEDSFGYIVGANEDYPLILPENTDTDNPAKQPASNGGKIAAGVILGVLALAAVAVAMLSGKKGKRKSSNKTSDPFGPKYR